MKIVYTKHAQEKFADLRMFGIIVTKSKIESALKKPKYKSAENDVEIKASEFDNNHNLRVIYKIVRSAIIIITFYVYRKGRYEEY